MPAHMTLTQAWLCEAIRIRETQWGPQDDRAARLRAHTASTDLGRVVSRAAVLGDAIDLPQAVHRFSQGGFFALIIAVVLALAGGGGSALTALGSGAQPVNVVWALIIILGINTLSLLAWALSMLWHGSGGWLAQAWQWLARKLVRGPEIALAGQAWWSIWRQAGAARWLLSGITHAIWTAANAAAVVVLLFALSTRHFSFVWETTLLSADVFVTITAVLGALPQWFGFLIPDAQVVRASGHVASEAANAQILWAGWLLGTLVMYGLVPRVLLLLISVARVVIAIPRTQPDLSAPYYVAVLARLQPSSLPPDGLLPSHGVLEASVSDIGVKRAAGSHVGVPRSSAAMITAIELDPTHAWPPVGLGAGVACTVLIDSRASRSAVLASVAQHTPRRLAISCNARHTPDRGTMRLIAELASFCGATVVWLQNADQPESHLDAWRAQVHGLTGIGLLESDAPGPVLAWLEEKNG